MTLSKYEQETIFIYNQGEPDCILSTHNPALIRKIEKLIENGEEIATLKRTDEYGEYSFTKKAIKVRFPKKLSEEKRVELAARMKAAREGSNGSK